MTAGAHVATMSTEPEVAGSKSSQLLKNCWSCRIISGGGLCLSGAYVFNAARKVMRQGAPTSMGTVAQITFALCEWGPASVLVPSCCLRVWTGMNTGFLSGLASWGIVILADPVGKAQRKTWTVRHPLEDICKFQSVFWTDCGCRWTSQGSFPFKLQCVNIYSNMIKYKFNHELKQLLIFFFLTVEKVDASSQEFP